MGSGVGMLTSKGATVMRDGREVMVMRDGREVEWRSRGVHRCLAEPSFFKDRFWIEDLLADISDDGLVNFGVRAADSLDFARFGRRDTRYYECLERVVRCLSKTEAGRAKWPFIRDGLLWAPDFGGRYALVSALDEQMGFDAGPGAGGSVPR